MYDDEIGADDRNQLSRRALIGGLGAAGAAVGLIGLSSGPIARAAGVPEAISPAITGLTYLGLDAFAFDVAGTNTTQRRIYQTITGVQPLTPPAEIFASLPVPAGSVIKQVNVAYQGQPIVTVMRRPLGTGTHEELTGLLLTTAGGGPKADTFAVDAPISSGATYAVRAFCSAGDSVLGVEVGYVPPPQAFVPFTGADPRVLDTRLGGNTPFAANEERTVDLSGKLIATGRAAVLNITATATGGPGFLAVFSDAIAYPGNSTVNFTGAGQTIANSAVCTMAAGKIKVHCGPAATDVIIDVVGTLL